MATISLAHRGTTTRRAMRSGDVGEKGAEAGIVSEGFSDLPRLWITLLYYSPYMIVSLCIYLCCIMLQARDKETEFLVIPVLLRLKERMIAAISNHSCQAFFPEGDTQETSKSQITLTTEPPMRIGRLFFFVTV